MALSRGVDGEPMLRTRRKSQQARLSLHSAGTLRQCGTLKRKKKWKKKIKPPQQNTIPTSLCPHSTSVALQGLSRGCLGSGLPLEGFEQLETVPNPTGQLITGLSVPSWGWWQRGTTRDVSPANNFVTAQAAQSNERLQTCPLKKNKIKKQRNGDVNSSLRL